MRIAARSSGYRTRQTLTGMTDEQLGRYVQAARTVTARLEVEGRLLVDADDRAAVAAGRQAQDELVSRHYKLAAHIARSWADNADDVDDLTQEGLIGLHRAIELWDPERGVPLGTWASQRIQQRCGRGANRLPSAMIRLPESHWERLRQVRAVERDLLARHGRETTTIEVADELGWTVEDVEDALDNRCCAALDAPIGNDGSPLGDLLPGDADTPADAARRIEVDAARRAVAAMLAVLPEAERIASIIEFGLDGRPQRSRAEAAKEQGITRERHALLVQRAEAMILHPRYLSRMAVAA